MKQSHCPMALLLRLLQSLTFLLFTNNNSGRQLCCFHLFMKDRSWTWYLKCYKYWLICFSYWEYCQDNLFFLSSFVSKCRVKLFGWNTHVFLSTSYQWQSNLFLLIQNVADFLQRMRKKNCSLLILRFPRENGVTWGIALCVKYLSHSWFISVFDSNELYPV